MNNKHTYKISVNKHR